MGKTNRELRYVPFDEWEIRENDGGPTKLVGYASVFNDETIIFEGTQFAFRERFMPGSFRKTIAENDIVASWNHNLDLVLGRTKNKTLQLAEDERGLRAIIIPPDTQAGRDAITSIRRGDVTGMSIMFRPIKTDPIRSTDDGEDLPLRTIREARLFELGPVAMPAYPTTSVKARHEVYIPEPDGEADDLENAYLIVRRAQMLGIELTNEQRQILTAAVELYQPYLLEPEPIHDASRDDGGHHSRASIEPEPEIDGHYSALERLRRLDILQHSVFQE